MIVFRYKNIEKLLWTTLLVFQFATWLFFTPLQSIKYYSLLIFVIEILSWPISVLLLFYVLKGRLEKQDNQRRLLVFVILGTLLGVLISYFIILLSVLYFASLIFFFIVLVVSGFKLSKAPKISI